MSARRTQSPNYNVKQERGSFEVSGFHLQADRNHPQVTPQVNASGFIKLTLAPEVSQKAARPLLVGRVERKSRLSPSARRRLRSTSRMDSRWA